MEIFLIVIAIVVLFPFLRNAWKAFFHPATILGNQAAQMCWIIDGREKDGIVNNMRYRRGNLIAVIPFNNPSVLLRYNGTEKRFRDFIEVERWIGKEIGIRDLEIDQRDEQKEIRKKELEVEQLYPQLDEDESFRKLDLEVEQLCAQLDEEARISEKELEINQRVNQKIEKFANYDFENAGKDISTNEIETVFDDFRKFIESGNKHGEVKELGKRCGQSIGAVLHYLSKKNDHLDPEKIFVSFSYAMYMIYTGFFEYLYDEKNVKKTQSIGWQFEAAIELTMTKCAQYIIGKDFENNYFKFYSEYDDFDNGEYEFWKERSDLKQQVLSVRNLIPRLNKRSFIYGYDCPESPDIDKDDDIDSSFTDYAFVRERLLHNPKEDPIQFLRDTKFLYTPLFVRFFFKTEIDK